MVARIGALVFAVLAVFIASAVADTPANCSYDDILGTWIFYEGERGNTKDLKCKNAQITDLKHQLQVELSFPNIATDQYGNQGVWTIIYNQGFEVTIEGRRYFAFSNFTLERDHQANKIQVISICNETFPGWSHDIYVRDWACYIGRKQGGPAAVKKHYDHLSLYDTETIAKLESKKYRNNQAMIERINRKQNLWKAREYPELEKYSLMDMVRRMGGIKSRVVGRPNSAPVTDKIRAQAENLPDYFDWRNVSGQNYVSPVRNQESCGSCYAFAATAEQEARYRVYTNNAQQYIFSPQDVVECSEYAQGCEGGFPYLIGGKYAEDFGLVTEDANPYKGRGGNCTTSPDARRYYATNYEYIGGYYGATNEPLMRLSLVNNGPIAVGFEVYSDFNSYSGGIYEHTGETDEVNDLNPWDPFQVTNHAVLIVGYGTDPDSNTPYWIVKNSWGATWGDHGYFLIRRGTDECGIESLAVEATPLPTY